MSRRKRSPLPALLEQQLHGGIRPARGPQALVSHIRERSLGGEDQDPRRRLAFGDDQGVVALAFVATHIGYSRKRNLTHEQRRELLLQGQYGIGLLGYELGRMAGPLSPPLARW